MAEVQDGYHQDARIQSYIMILLLAQIAAMLYSTETSSLRLQYYHTT